MAAAAAANPLCLDLQLELHVVSRTRNLTPALRVTRLQEGIFRRSGVKSRINLLMNSSYFSGSAGNNNNHGVGGSSSLNQSQETVLEEACAYDVADFLKGCSRPHSQHPLSVGVLISMSSSFLPLSSRNGCRLVPEPGSPPDDGSRLPPPSSDRQVLLEWSRGGRRVERLACSPACASESYCTRDAAPIPVQVCSQV